MMDKGIACAEEPSKVTLAEVRETLDISAEYAEALPEYTNERRLRRRGGDGQVIR